ncbi:MAG: tRNA lysidine(34) synthetase TilS [Deltaproteobacteria bacterium]|nr:tRNA lysidine(34) synthetase TilS [Deltaproteobacteria bacterium]
MLLSVCSDFLRRQLPPAAGGHLLAAVSGGLDSMVMLHLLQRCRRELALPLRLVVVHFNHRLRPAASAEEKFVAASCRHAGLPLLIGQRQGGAVRLSEEAAREARYAFFARCLAAYPDSWLLTAHTASDQLETVLLNLLRGSGLRGLKGIPGRRQKFLRPLLAVSRREMEEYARRHDLDYLEDESNASLAFTRNRLRHQVLPLLREIAGPELDRRAAAMAAGLAGDWQFIDNAAARFCQRQAVAADGGISCSRMEFLAQPEGLQPYILARLLRQAGREKQATRRLLAALRVFIARGGGRSGKGFRLGKGLTCRVGDEDFVIGPPAAETSPGVLEIPAPGHYCLPAGGRLSLAFCSPPAGWCRPGDRKREYVDAGRLSFPLQVRHWRPGDRFCPLGLGGHRQKLKKFFTAAQLSAAEKAKTPLLCHGSEIIWVVGQRLDERFALRPESEKCLELSYDV